jgi:hypothetical protein
LNAFVWSIFVNYFPSIAQYFILFTQDPSSASPGTTRNVWKFTQKPETTIELEILNYLERANRGPKDIDVLEYWRGQSKILPKLATLARYIFCLPTTRGSNEKFIVKPGDIIQPRRTLLDCADTEKLIFCHENYFQLRPFVSSWELDDAEYISGSDTSGSSLSDSELGDEPGNSDTRY